MSRKTWGVVGLGATLFVVVWLLLLREKARTPSEEYARAAFTRPTILPTIPSGLRVRIANTDGLSGVPTVESGVSVTIEVTLPPSKDPELGFVFVVPRLRSQGAEGFHWIYPSCDQILGLSKDGRIVKGTARTLNQQRLIRRSGEVCPDLWKWPRTQ